ncbi:molybdenum cofactor biosynthesis protein MoaE [Miltoncostaea marina]|uniref:molybdenum cofactor biosynthesis protein MoaE n=1 Tax=Miltoncostaea marina TaxID=2843215 RepID=UPI001C3D1A94|nr:molybdenum cofactor biosynthesis protein MoaE [Miltoncostaea marina]
MIGLNEGPIDPAAVLAAVADPDHGGTALFVGTTRREAGEREVAELFYEAYEELALAEMQAIAEEAREAYGAKVAVLHRVGAVAVGEPSVAVAASAGHRPAAFAACRHVIDELKARAPIWKQAVRADGAAAWMDGRAVAPVPEAARRPDAR